MIPSFRIRHIRQNLQNRLLLDLRETARNRQPNWVRVPESVDPLLDKARPEDWNVIFLVDALPNEADDFGHTDALLDGIIERLGYTRTDPDVEYRYPSWHLTAGIIQNTKGFQPSEIAEYLTSRWQTHEGRVADYVSDGTWEDEEEDEDGQMIEVTYYGFTQVSSVLDKNFKGDMPQQVWEEAEEERYEFKVLFYFERR